MSFNNSLFRYINGFGRDVRSSASHLGYQTRARAIGNSVLSSTWFMSGISHAIWLGGRAGGFCCCPAFPLASARVSWEGGYDTLVFDCCMKAVRVVIMIVTSRNAVCRSL